MDPDLWGLVLEHLTFAQQCKVRACERAARMAHISMEEFSVKRCTTENGVSFAHAVTTHVLIRPLKPGSQRMSLILCHVPLGSEGAYILSKGHFDSLSILNLVNCNIGDVGASIIVEKTKDIRHTKDCLLYTSPSPRD